MNIREIKPIRSHLSSIHKDLSARSDEPELSIKSLPILNRKIWGLRSADLTIIGARTSQGKSAFSLQIAYDLASQSIPVLFLSLEMSVEALIERLFCNVELIDNYDLLTGKFKTTPEIQEKWDSFNEKVSKIPLLITCGVGKTFNEINELVQLVEPKPKAVIIDFVQAIAIRSGQGREMINEYIRQFRQLALENKFAGVLASQINRGAMLNQDKEPYLFQLKETGVLEEGASTVFLLHWQNFYDKNPKSENKYKVVIAKQRNGRTGEHILDYQPQYYKFTEIETRFTKEENYTGKSLPQEVENTVKVFSGEVVPF